MNKTWWLIGLGTVIIIAVMVFLTIRGVSHREHTFIKWSEVSSPRDMASACMLRLFPYLRDKKAVQIIGEPPVVDEFANGFIESLVAQNLANPVEVAKAPQPGKLAITIIKMATNTKPGSCVDVERDICLMYKAQRLWHKKERDLTKYWFLFQWVNKDQFYLFYTSPLAQ